MGSSDISFEAEEGMIVSSSAPKLSAVDKLYVRAYLSTLDHVKSHRAAAPSLKSHHADNSFSRKEAVQFHIALGMQEAYESFSLSPEAIIAKLYKEATREGNGSNHAARVTALTVLGKQLGMFQEKKESIVPTINIISYAEPSKRLQVVEEEASEVTSEPTYSISTDPIDYEVKFL
jgi:hypothetical protein